MPTSADRLFSAIVRVNGAESDDFYKCIERITVEEDLEIGSAFEVRLSLSRNDDGSWPHAKENSLRAWNRVTIIAAFQDHADVIMDGYISHVHLQTNPQAASLTVDFRGVDASYVMNLEDKCVVWSGETYKTYEQIAQEIVESYGFRIVLPDSAAQSSGGSAPAPSVSQRTTDHKFLRELARRKGYEFYMRGRKAYFRPADLSGTPQKLIATNFGEATNCGDLQVWVDGTKPTAAAMTRIDPMTGQIETASAISTENGLQGLGTDDLSAIRGYGVSQTKVVVRRQGAASLAQMNDFVQGVLRRHGWWVRGRGRLNGLRYGRTLRSKRTVTIKGFGTDHNGIYYVQKVKHTLGPRSYSMEFECVRNRLGRTGAEDFTEERLDAMPIPAAAGPGAGPGDFEMPSPGSRVV